MILYLFELLTLPPCSKELFRKFCKICVVPRKFLRDIFGDVVHMEGVRYVTCDRHYAHAGQGVISPLIDAHPCPCSNTFRPSHHYRNLMVRF